MPMKVGMDAARAIQASLRSEYEKLHDARLGGIAESVAHKLLVAKAPPAEADTEADIARAVAVCIAQGCEVLADSRGN